MNKMKKLLAVLLSAFTVGTCVVGCGGNAGNGSDEPQTLDIYNLEQGYGKQWLTNVIELFKEQDWVKEKYPNLTVSAPTNNDQVGFATQRMELGEKYNKYDLLFGAGSLDGYYGTKQVLDLTDIVYNAEVPGEGILYKDKLNESVPPLFSVPDDKTGENRYYATPYFVGQYGIIYNPTELAKFTDEVPRTTNELIEVMDAVKAGNVKSGVDKSKAAKYSFIWGKDGYYWDKEDSILSVWWGQYNGAKGYDNFYNGIDNGQRSAGIFKQKGRLYAMEVVEKILAKANGYYDPASFDLGYKEAQTAFLIGQSVFHYNGDYFMDEMKEEVAKLEQGGYDVPDVKMMRTPIISKIIEKCDTIADDAELSALVKAIDAGSTALTGEGYAVSKDDFDTICEARGIVVSIGSAPSIIPAYAAAKDVAVDFLRFMATDIAIAAYAEGTGGSTIAFDCNLPQNAPETYNKLTPFHQERLAYMNASNLTINVLRSPSSYALCSYGGVKIFADETFYSAFTGGTGKTAQKFYDETLQKWDAASFQSALDKSGLA